MKPFLILQLRPEDVASNDEFNAFVQGGNLADHEVERIRMEQTGLPELDPNDYSGIIIGGGPFNACEPEESKSQVQQRFEAPLQRLLHQVVEQDTPYLGACYGLGALTITLGGSVAKGRYSEPVEAVTIAFTEAATHDPLTTGLDPEFRAFNGHKESAQELPPGATLLASSATCLVHMIRVGRNVYATQFHPELDSPTYARRIHVYKNAGYFPPEDAEKLAEAALNESALVPRAILQRFVERYRISK